MLFSAHSVQWELWQWRFCAKRSFWAWSVWVAATPPLRFSRLNWHPLIVVMKCSGGGAGICKLARAVAGVCKECDSAGFEPNFQFFASLLWPHEGSHFGEYAVEAVPLGAWAFFFVWEGTGCGRCMWSNREWLAAPAIGATPERPSLLQGGCWWPLLARAWPSAWRQLLRQVHHLCYWLFLHAGDEGHLGELDEDCGAKLRSNRRSKDCSWGEVLQAHDAAHVLQSHGRDLEGSRGREHCRCQGLLGQSGGSTGAHGPIARSPCRHCMGTYGRVLGIQEHCAAVFGSLRSKMTTTIAAAIASQPEGIDVYTNTRNAQKLRGVAFVKATHEACVGPLGGHVCVREVTGVHLGLRRSNWHLPARPSCHHQGTGLPVEQSQIPRVHHSWPQFDPPPIRQEVEDGEDCVSSLAAFRCVGLNFAVESFHLLEGLLICVDGWSGAWCSCLAFFMFLQAWHRTESKVRWVHGMTQAAKRSQPCALFLMPSNPRYRKSLDRSGVSVAKSLLSWITEEAAN